jgi:NADH dehydrogenase
VIVGAGFGGLTTAQRLARAPVDLTVIDRRNHHLFQPLLYQVATAGLSPADIAMPVRRVLSGQANAAVVLGEVEGVDLDGRAVTVDGRRIGYDFLVLATGAGTPILATTSGSLSRPA